MRGLFFLLLVSVALFGQQPQLYRWKDRDGKEHVTNTPPPGNATPLVVPPLENKKEPEHDKAKAVPAHALNQPNHGASEESWRVLGLQIRAARTQGDLPTLQQTAQKVLRHALWGDGLWALALLPVAALALVTLLGWWIGGTVEGVAGHLITVLAFVAGLGLAHLCLGRFIYRAQAQRLREAAAALQGQLLEPESQPTAALQDLQAKGAALEEGLSPKSPPWRFPSRVTAFKQALQQAMVSP